MKKPTQEFKYINYNRIGRIVFMVLINFLVFFGYICNFYGEEPIDTSLIWYYQLFLQVKFSTIFGLKFIPVLPIILVFIGYFLTEREEVSLIGIKISLYFVPLTSFFSIIWYWINIEKVSFEPFLLLFGSINGYFTIIVTIACILFGSYMGIKVKQYGLLKRNMLRER